MELKLENGRYLPAAGGLAEVSGAEELAQRVTMKLCARRGKFYLMPDYGSRLYTLINGTRPADREAAVRTFVAEALKDEPVKLTDIKMNIQGDRLLLDLKFACSEGYFTVNTVIGEEI